MAQSESVADTAGDGDDVLERSPQFHADDIVVGVKAEPRIAELALHGLGQFCISRRDGKSRRIASRHFHGKRGPTERADAGREAALRSDYLRNHFGHSQKRGFLQALGCADEQHARVQVRTQVQKQTSAVLRGHDAHHNVGLTDRPFKVAGCRDAVGDDLAGKKLLVDMVGGNRIAHFRFVRPQANAMGAVASQSDRQAGSPGTGADDSDLTHPRLPEKRFSVLASKRRMLS